MTIEQDVQELDGDKLVSLYILDTTTIGGADIYKFTTLPDAAGEVVFDGDTYTPVDIEATGFNWDGQGAFPRPKIRVANVGGALTAAVITYGDMVGAQFTRIRTFARHLDNGSDPDPTAVFAPEIFVVDQRTQQNKIFIEWQLSSVLDQLGVTLPRRQCIRDTCTHRYRIWDADTETFDYSVATCPYVGGNSFDEENVATTSANDACSRTLKGCKLRFGAAASLPTRAMPGIDRVRR